MQNTVINELQTSNSEPFSFITEWSKIESFLEAQTELFYEMVEDSTNNSTYLIDSQKLRLIYETNYNCLKNYIEKGITAGEFAPQYPVSICVDLFITTLEGLKFNSMYIYSNKKNVSDQIKIIKEQLKDVLVVI